MPVPKSGLGSPVFGSPLSKIKTLARSHSFYFQSSKFGWTY